MSSTAAFRRNPLVISGNHLSSGDRSTTFSSATPSSLLRSYLIFVRDMRGQRREPSIELRSEDVSVLAAHLGVSDEYVLGGLLDLMGATRAQRNTMMAMLAAGALTIVLTGSFVSDLSSDGISVEMSRLAEAVQAAASGSEAASAASASSSEATGAASTARVAAADAATPHAATPTAAALEITAAATPDAEASVASSETSTRSVRAVTLTEVVRSATSEVLGGDEASQVAQAAQQPVSIGVTSDGSVVASVAPPVPAASDDRTATAQLPDGTTVGVAEPPIPPPPPDEQVATAQLPDGTTVGVAAPPVPPAPPAG